MRLYTRLHSCILLYLLALSAVIGGAFRRLDHRLIAAAPQCKVDGIPGKLVILRIGKAVQTNTDTDGHRHLVADVHRLDILQQVKPGFLQLRHGFLAHDHKIFVFLKFFHNSVQRGDILVHLSVDQCDQERSSDLLHTLQRLLVVVQIQKPHCKALIVHLLQGNMQRRLIKQVYRDQVAVVALRLDHIAVFRHFLQGNALELCNIILAVIGHFVLCLFHAVIVGQTIPRDGREQRHDGFAVTLWLPDHIFKCLVRPDHLTRVVQQGMRQLQLPKQPLLDLSVLCGKADQLVDNDRFIIKIKRQRNSEIEYREKSQQKPGAVIDGKHARIHHK